MSRTTVILCGLTLGFIGAQSQATTYYLDSKSGDNFHAGAKASTPWQTLRYASSMLYHPGDQILLKAGSVWQGETLDISTTDESDEPITVGSYGAGSQPVLDGLNTPAAGRADRRGRARQPATSTTAATIRRPTSRRISSAKRTRGRT